VELQHLVKPGTEEAPGPYHFVIVRVDNGRFEMQVVGVGAGKGYAPYGGNQVELEDAAK
jgi:hypothetical protein